MMCVVRRRTNCSGSEFCSVSTDSPIAHHFCMATTGSTNHQTCSSDADCAVGMGCDAVVGLCVSVGGECVPP